MIELRLVVSMRKKGHDYRFLSPLSRNIVNGLINFFWTLFDSLGLYIIGIHRQYCDISHRDVPDAGVDRTGSAARENAAPRVKTFPWTSGATQWTMELPMTVTVMFSCWLGPADDVTVLEGQLHMSVVCFRDCVLAGDGGFAPGLLSIWKRFAVGILTQGCSGSGRWLDGDGFGVGMLSRWLRSWVPEDAGKLMVSISLPSLLLWSSTRLNLDRRLPFSAFKSLTSAWSAASGFRMDSGDEIKSSIFSVMPWIDLGSVRHEWQHQTPW